MQSFLVIQSRMQFEGGEMIVIAVQPVKQVIYFFFISLKLCNTEQYRMGHWRLLSSSHLRISIHSSSSIFQSILINRAVINRLMHTFLIWCNKSCSISWRNFNTSNLNPPPPPPQLGGVVRRLFHRWPQANLGHVSQHCCWFGAFLFLLWHNKGSILFGVWKMTLLLRRSLNLSHCAEDE